MCECVCVCIHIYTYMYLYIYTCIRTYTHTYVYICVYLYVHIHTCVCARISTCMCMLNVYTHIVCMCVYIQMRVYMCKCIYLCTCVCERERKCVCVYIHIQYVSHANNSAHPITDLKATLSLEIDEHSHEHDAFQSELALQDSSLKFRDLEMATLRTQMEEKDRENAELAAKVGPLRKELGLEKEENGKLKVQHAQIELEKERAGRES